MGHHGDDASAFMDRLSPEVQAQMDKAAEKLEGLTKEQGLGATGRFPMGRLNANDEGELRMAVGIESGKVIINFGKPVAWFGMDPEQAKLLAQSILEKRAKILKI